MKKLIIPLIILSSLLFSCSMGNSEQENIPATKEPIEAVKPATPGIKNFALGFAKLYASRETEFVIGAQGSLRSAITPPTSIEINKKPIQLDCSGFVVMCYKYACVDTKYSLLANDMSVGTMYNDYTEPTDNPQPGDLVFMGSGYNITHVGIFVEEKDGKIYFFDCTKKDAEGGAPAVNGVSMRSYQKNDKKIKDFGVMKIKYLVK